MTGKRNAWLVHEGAAYTTPSPSCSFPSVIHPRYSVVKWLVFIDFAFVHGSTLTLGSQHSLPLSAGYRSQLSLCDMHIYKNGGTITATSVPLVANPQSAVLQSSRLLLWTRSTYNGNISPCFSDCANVIHLTARRLTFFGAVPSIDCTLMGHADWAVQSCSVIGVWLIEICWKGSLSTELMMRWLMIWLEPHRLFVAFHFL